MFNLCSRQPEFLFTIWTSQIDWQAQSLKEYGLGIPWNVTEVSSAAHDGPAELATVFWTCQLEPWETNATFILMPCFPPLSSSILVIFPFSTYDHQTTLRLTPTVQIKPNNFVQSPSWVQATEEQANQSMSAICICKGHMKPPQSGGYCWYQVPDTGLYHPQPMDFSSPSCLDPCVACRGRWCVLALCFCCICRSGLMICH